MLRTCSFCKEAKTLDKFDKNGKYLYSVCKDCKRLKTVCRRYNLSIKDVEFLFAFKNCMCCDEPFKSTRLRHIHHTSSGVRGIVCQRCNHVLGQETKEDLYRIQSCIEFIAGARKNLLNRDNPQERPSTKELKEGILNDYTLGSYRICNKCGEEKPFSEFSQHSVKNPWKRLHCKSCASAMTAAKTYGITLQEVFDLRKKTHCDCCNSKLTKKNKADIHHIGVVRGLVCHHCNRLLVDESREQLLRLLACERWILDDEDIVCSAWRHAEASRNDSPLA
ncbi:hypothetical protein DRJ25_05125 [Candidatus Woesearchaeota archaeon]|nr:MAG: hypothetical protein DRJ25_05125 [Candidatus Woesearchaeota archaeon]